MKAQMENMMKMSQGGDMNAMMPKGFTVKIKNQNTLTKMEGGMMDGQEVLHQKDKNQAIRIDRANKTYTILPSGAPDDSHPAPAVKVTKTVETAKILGYNCTKYIAEVSAGERPTTQVFWTTTDIKDFDLKSLAHQRMGQGASLFYEQIEGVPLKIEMSMPKGNMKMEATEIKRESIKAEDFIVPADYKEVKMPGKF
jgi:hypothetical protein